MNNIEEFQRVFKETFENSELEKSREFIQHGDTSCLLHSIAVAYYSYRFAQKFGFMDFHKQELVRGALLHDYFLYDWHEKNSGHGLHGFSHPKKALENAKMEFELTKIECDIIKKHMFPLTIASVPLCRESVLVCIVDKVCSTYEVFKRKAYQNQSIRYAYEN